MTIISTGRATRSTTSRQSWTRMVVEQLDRLRGCWIAEGRLTAEPLGQAGEPANRLHNWRPATWRL